jgi:nucleoside-diphosphate-sugar epimerase
MRIIVTGASGVIGRSSLPGLLAGGHDVVGFHHGDAGAEQLRQAGVEPRRVDLLDAAAVRRELRGADAVIHLATAIPPLAKVTKAHHWALNDRLRSEATRLLVEAAEWAGVRRVVAESVSFNYVDRGGHWITEDDEVEPVFRPTSSALVSEENVARFAADGAIGVSLRFAQLYGPGRASHELVEAVRARKVPMVGAGDNYVSSIHVEDAGAAVVAALRAPSGRFNVADDQPLRARERLALQVASVGAPPPRHVPAPIARLLVGKAVHQLTVSQRILNRRFRDATGWVPRYPSLREGWPTVITARTSEVTAG